MTGLVLALLVAAGPPAAAPSAKTQAPPSPSAAKPVDIRSDRLVAHQSGRTVVFEGHVRVRQPPYAMTCERLVVHYGKNQRVERLVAEGAVHFTQGDRVATAKRAELDNVHRTLTLTGDPVLTEGPNVIHGNTMVVDLTTGQVRVEQVKAKVRVGDVVKAGGKK